MSKPSVAFLGLGIMGGGMAARLLAAGFPLGVYNRNAERAAGLAAKGARLAASAREAVSGARIVVSMLADDAASRALWLGENGAISGVAAGTLLIECSTVTVGWINELSAAAKGRECELLDAPVTGSKSHAAAGELTFLVGGTESAIALAQPVLAAMGKQINHLGPTGSGAMMKLINNFVCGVQVTALAEGLAFIERSGLNSEAALAVLTGGAPGSPLVKALSARMTARDYTPNFLLKLMAKDLAYAKKEASNVGLDLTTARCAMEVFAKAIAAGYGEKDFAAIIEPMRSTK